jgi:SAM-dependent methyltransferase
VRSTAATWTSDLRLAWHEYVLDRFRGRVRCPMLDLLLADPLLAGTPVREELTRVVDTIVGRRLTATVVGEDAWRQSLTDFFRRGEALAQQLRAHIQGHEILLEYGGGVGRMGRAIAPHVTRLISVDANPLMTKWGQRLNPEISFHDLGELPEGPIFDGAYSVALFFHLPLAEQQRALEYVYRRLKPGGWFLVDQKLGPQTEPACAPYGEVHATSVDDFRTLYDPLFTARRVPLFNSGFLLRKKHEVKTSTPASSADAAAASAAVADGRYVTNDTSVVADLLEGEVVVVNLDNGAYYILPGTASLVWQCLATGRRVSEIADALARVFTASAAAIEPSVAAFVAQLAEEQLILPAVAEGSVDAITLAPSDVPFSDPVMFRYTDMQALIQMDPIREYDETGWPRRHVPWLPPAKG